MRVCAAFCVDSDLVSAVVVVSVSVIILVVVVVVSGFFGVLALIHLKSGEHCVCLILRDAAVGDVVLGRDAEEHGVRVTDARSKESGVV